MVSEQKRTDIASLMPEELTEFVKSLGEPAYRGGQIFSALSRGLDFDGMTTISKALRAKLSELCELRLPRVREKLVSKLDGTVKFLFEMIDGECIESVFMRYEHGNTICISTQAGCRMGCRFCASTLRGLSRNLTASEMLGQIIVAGREMGERISNIVMMGIGEPLDNFDNVVRFLRLVNHPDGLGIGYRHISLSTCGLVDRIRELASLELPITLSISLHSPDDAVRSSLMPINNKWNIHELLSACADYYRTTGRRISFEYTLIRDRNDSPADAAALADCLEREFRKKCGAPVHVNLIRVNESGREGISRGSTDSAVRFASELSRRRINATVRRRMGADVNAACGQLRSSVASEQK